MLCIHHFLLNHSSLGHYVGRLHYTLLLSQQYGRLPFYKITVIRDKFTQFHYIKNSSTIVVAVRYVTKVAFDYQNDGTAP